MKIHDELPKTQKITVDLNLESLAKKPIFSGGINGDIEVYGNTLNELNENIDIVISKCEKNLKRAWNKFLKDDNNWDTEKQKQYRPGLGAGTKTDSAWGKEIIPNARYGSKKWSKRMYIMTWFEEY